jgi:predicted O-methyltransferase YrrM
VLGFCREKVRNWSGVEMASAQDLFSTAQDLIDGTTVTVLLAFSALRHGQNAQPGALARGALFRARLPEEKFAIAEIESIRHEMLASNSEISIADHGAGSRHHTILRLPISVLCRRSKSPCHARFLLDLVRVVKPRNGIELGTNLGISAAYIASGMRLNGFGTLTTIEGDPSLACIAASNFRRLGLDNCSLVRGLFEESLSEILAKDGLIDFAFIDGHHDGEATVSYFDAIHRRASAHAVILLDDIRWSAGMREAWSHISRGRDHIDLGKMGLVFGDLR